MKKSIFNYTTFFISMSYSLFANASPAIKSTENRNNEVLEVYSTPLHTPQEKMAIPVSVLTQEDLRANRSASIAETLTSLPGFHASFLVEAQFIQLFEECQAIESRYYTVVVILWTYPLLVQIIQSPVNPF
ncbi:hypothetical protein ACMHUM_04020 [Proteus mirabilis]